MTPDQMQKRIEELEEEKKPKKLHVAKDSNYGFEFECVRNKYFLNCYELNFYGTEAVINFKGSISMSGSILEHTTIELNCLSVTISDGEVRIFAQAVSVKPHRYHLILMDKIRISDFEIKQAKSLWERVKIFFVGKPVSSPANGNKFRREGMNILEEDECERCGEEIQISETYWEYEDGSVMCSICAKVTHEGVAR